MPAVPPREDGADALRSAAVAVDLPGRGALAVLGPDAAATVHGLVTNEVKSLRPGAGCHAALLTPKGRMRAELVVLRSSEEELLLDCDPALAGPLAEILAGYVPFSRSRLEDRTAAVGIVHLEGPQASGVLAAAGLPVPGTAPYDHVADGTGSGIVRVVRVSRAGEAGFDLRASRERAPSLLERLVSGGARAAGLDVLEAGRIEEGIPRWGAELTESVLPNEAGLERTAISYTKGCYLGQETVARLKTYGHVNRHLVALILPPGSGVAPGDAVRSEDAVVGKVTSAAESERRGRRVALAFVKREHEAPGTRLDVESAGGAVPGVVAAVPLEP